LREGSSGGCVCLCTLQGAALHAEDDELTSEDEVGLAKCANPTSRTAAASVRHLSVVGSSGYCIVTVLGRCERFLDELIPD
jgi:hypothetical protein